MTIGNEVPADARDMPDNGPVRRPEFSREAGAKVSAHWGLAMTYGHAERNLACIRQLEAETLHSSACSAPDHGSPSDQLPGDDERAPAEVAATTSTTDSPGS